MELTPGQLRVVVFVLAAVIPATLVMLGVTVFRWVDTPDEGTVAEPAPTTTTSSTAASPARETRSLVAWAAAALPHDAAVAAAPGAVPLLRRAGFTDVTGTTSSDADSDYVLGPDDTAPASRSRPLAREGGSSVREAIGPEQADRTTERLRDDRALCRQGGRQLLANRSVSVDVAIRALLQDGRLDLRVLNVIGALAADDRVRLTDPVVDRREQRAGRPVRIVTVGSADAAALAGRVLALPEPYRPRSVDVTSRRTVRVAWLPTLFADQPVGN